MKISISLAKGMILTAQTKTARSEITYGALREKGKKGGGKKMVGEKEEEKGEEKGEKGFMVWIWNVP